MFELPESEQIKINKWDIDVVSVCLHQRKMEVVLRNGYEKDKSFVVVSAGKRFVVSDPEFGEFFRAFCFSMDEFKKVVAQRMAK